MRKNKYRDYLIGNVTEEKVGETLKVAGFVENMRDHGGVIFVDLRDESGMIQLVCNDESLFSEITRESTLTATGLLRMRKEIDFNPNIESGRIEILVDNVTLLGRANNVLPFEVKTSHEVSEDIRLKYRFLDMRNKRVHDNIKFRSEILKFIRNKMDSMDFMEVQTPIITASSPEGARDFLIPSRKHHGKFYALPQAPQIFKQLLMVGGFNKYYQIAPCFRDEDCRADRTLEFYQLDLEMAFAEEEDVYEVGEEIFHSIFTTFSNRKVSDKPFRRISYKEAMLKYGTDKPDLRNPLEIIDLSEIFLDSGFNAFKGVTVRGIKVEGISDKPNSWFNEISTYATSLGMPGIGYLTVNEDKTFKGPIDKFLSDKERAELIKVANLEVGNIIFFIADKNEEKCAKFAGSIRIELGKKLDLIDNEVYEFCIVNDFPLFEYNEEDGKYDFGHNPFSMPKGGIEALDNSNLCEILAHQYDFVCNGNEVASGAIRNHDIECLEKAFEIVGYSKEVLLDKFKSLYNAFQYGPPPHAGMAPGIDRIIMLLRDEPNLREVQAFPMSVSGMDSMMGCPSEVSEQQLREIHIKLR